MEKQLLNEYMPIPEMATKSNVVLLDGQQKELRNLITEQKK
jgi:hypothetical protein